MVKILVVEDTPSEMQLMTLYLKDNGYQVVSADNAKDGLNLVTKEKPDIVITDVVMEGMNGFEFCRTLKKAAMPSARPARKPWPRRMLISRPRISSSRACRIR